MFTPGDRSSLRDTLIETAHADRDVVGAALVGSAATGREDPWSDIDLVLQIRADADPADVAERWTADLYADHGAVHHLDVIAGGVLYRVFLLASSLQVDVSFWPEHQFRATEQGFTLLFGTPQPSTEPADIDPAHVTGWAWLYALHSRSAIARGRTWQAVMMLDHLRDQVLALACIRHGLNPHHGREADRLPSSVLDALAAARAAGVEREELARSHDQLLRLLGDEIEQHDRDLSAQLRTPLRALARIDG